MTVLAGLWARAGTLELSALLLVVVAALVVTGSALLVPVTLRELRRMRPSRRARALLVLAAAPFVVPALVLAIAFAPSLPAALGLGGDHCMRHTDHLHLCLVHGSPALASVWGASLPLVLLAGLAALLATVRRMLHVRRVQASLCLGCEGELRPGVGLLASSECLSLTVGLWRPRIYLSSALAGGLGRAELDVVVAHERAHARRRDGLSQLAARGLSNLHLPGVRRRLLAELELACEQACDEVAAWRVGDRLQVAETLVVVERLARRGEHAASACAFGGSSVPDRIRNLLEPHAPAPRSSFARWARWAGWAVAAALALSVADPLHHLAEHLLGLLVG